MKAHHVILVALTTACGLTTAIDQAKFDAVHRAGRALRESVAAGITLLRFREMVGTYGTEASLAHDRAQSDLERKFTDFHLAALKAYRDSLRIWAEKIEQGGTHIATNVGRSSVGLEPIIDEYSLTVERLDKTLLRFDADEAIQKIWQRADAKLDAADALYRGER